MSAGNSYDAFISQLERKHQVEAQGHNSYFEVFNEASRLTDQLKRGLNVSIHRERLSEVRVAAQSWQESCYNERTEGNGVDILDWQPRYAHLDLSEGAGVAGSSGVGAGGSAVPGGPRASRSATAGFPIPPSVSHPRRRSNTSPSARRAGYSTAATVSGGEPPSPAAAVQLSAVDQAVSEPLTPACRSGYHHGGGLTPSPPGDPAGPARRNFPAGPGKVCRGRRATDSLMLHPRRGSSSLRLKDGRGRPSVASIKGDDGRQQRLSQQQQQNHQQLEQLEQQQQQQQPEEEDCGEESGEDVDQAGGVVGGERSFVGATGATTPRLPPLDEPSGPVLLSPTVMAHGGSSRADEAIRVFARTAYEPGEHRHTLLLMSAPEGFGGIGGDGPDSHYPERLPLAPIPRTVPRHVAEALSSLMLPSGIRASMTLNAEGTRVRASGGSFTTAMSPRAAALGGSGAGSGEGPPLLVLPGRAPRRASISCPWDPEPPNSLASPSRIRAAAAAAASRDSSGSNFAGPSGAHLSGNFRPARESYAGPSCGGGVISPTAASSCTKAPVLGGSSVSGETSASASVPGLIKGYAGGGPLDHRMLDMVPRLGLDAPRVKANMAAGPGALQMTGAVQSLAGEGEVQTTGVRFARGRRASATGIPGLAAPSGGVSLGPMMVTREQVDSYVAVHTQVPTGVYQGQVQCPGQSHSQLHGVGSAKGLVAAGSGRPGHNVIGTRGCLSDDAGPQAPRALRREMATSEAPGHVKGHET
ncbi:hypothetical protein VaNZ11_000691 [Volvox africanus]|uniref:Uncharacterized protein n=1 Tax=Volvox africanus TaxID=51714 RepID=A0ABQ5RMX9_9CHLO|nr:hypothetical protein VaNZ11_000691 [Volvox africanus]